MKIYPHGVARNRLAQAASRLDVPILVVENKVDIVDSGSDRLKMSAASGLGVQEVMAALRESVKHLEGAEPLF